MERKSSAKSLLLAPVVAEVGAPQWEIVIDVEPRIGQKTLLIVAQGAPLPESEVREPPGESGDEVPGRPDEVLVDVGAVLGDPRWVLIGAIPLGSRPFRFPLCRSIYATSRFLICWSVIR